jgi:hypothetical protein
VYDSFVEVYELSGNEQAVQVCLDKDEARAVDVEPVPGFTLAAEAPP